MNESISGAVPFLRLAVIFSTRSLEGTDLEILENGFSFLYAGPSSMKKLEYGHGAGMNAT